MGFGTGFITGRDGFKNATSRFCKMDPVVGRIKRFKESINRYYQQRGETCVL